MLPRDDEAHFFDPARCFTTCASTWREGPALACGYLPPKHPPWQATFEVGLAVTPANFHKLELLKPPPFHVQNGDAADPRNIAALAHVDVTLGRETNKQTNKQTRR